MHSNWKASGNTKSAEYKSEYEEQSVHVNNNSKKIVTLVTHYFVCTWFFFLLSFLGEQWRVRCREIAHDDFFLYHFVFYKWLDSYYILFTLQLITSKAVACRQHHHQMDATSAYSPENDFLKFGIRIETNDGTFHFKTIHAKWKTMKRNDFHLIAIVKNCNKCTEWIRLAQCEIHLSVSMWKIKKERNHRVNFLLHYKVLSRLMLLSWKGHPHRRWHTLTHSHTAIKHSFVTY